MGSSYKLWSKRLQGDTLTRGQISQWGNAIYAGFLGYRMGGARTNLTEAECVDLVGEFGDHIRTLNGFGYRLTEEHTEFGLEWLHKDLTRAETIGVTQEVLDGFIGFRFIGSVLVKASPDGWWVSTAPEYRVLFRSKVPTYRVWEGKGSEDPGKALEGYTETEDYIDYSWSPWQGKVYA